MYYEHVSSCETNFPPKIKVKNPSEFSDMKPLAVCSFATETLPPMKRQSVTQRKGKTRSRAENNLVGASDVVHSIYAYNRELSPRRCIFNAEDGGSMSLRNVGTELQGVTFHKTASFTIASIRHSNLTTGFN